MQQTFLNHIKRYAVDVLGKHTIERIIVKKLMEIDRAYETFPI